MGSSFYILDGEEEAGLVATASEDDFHYFRDSVHAALEQGEFGSTFPLFMTRFEPDEWKVEELAALQGELETIAKAFKGMPPEPLDSNWRSKAARSGKKHASLYEVFVDEDGAPLLGRLMDLCALAQKEGKPILLR